MSPPRRRGLRSEHPGIAGAMRPSMSWDPWPRPVARATVGRQECTQIGENGLLEPFWGICVHCCDVVGGCGVAGVYTDWRKRPLGAVLVHSCTLFHRCNTARPAGDSAGATKKGRTCGLKEGRLLVRRLTKRRSLRLPCRTECAFPLHHRPGGVGRNPPPPACGALWKVAQLGKCARATPRQAAGGLRRGPAGPGLGPGRTERRSLGRGPR